MKTEELALLKTFQPYQDFKKGSGTDRTKPTFYNWCNNIFKLK
jgi:hypothetical protein